jgi:hypothetical protein
LDLRCSFFYLLLLMSFSSFFFSFLLLLPSFGSLSFAVWVELIRRTFGLEYFSFSLTNDVYHSSFLHSSRAIRRITYIQGVFQGTGARGMAKRLRKDTIHLFQFILSIPSHSFMSSPSHPFV